MSDLLSTVDTSDSGSFVGVTPLLFKPCGIDDVKATNIGVISNGIWNNNLCFGRGVGPKLANLSMIEMGRSFKWSRKWSIPYKACLTEPFLTLCQLKLVETYEINLIDAGKPEAGRRAGSPSSLLFLPVIAEHTTYRTRYGLPIGPVVFLRPTTNPYYPNPIKRGNRFFGYTFFATILAKNSTRSPTPFVQTFLPHSSTLNVPTLRQGLPREPICSEAPESIPHTDLRRSCVGASDLAMFGGPPYSLLRIFGPSEAFGNLIPTAVGASGHRKLPKAFS
ncbi:hypothetical protein CROQUDRAFT_87628 [Cronartium quercuum f. sp. fusiforme G11]|uniref:Uncharacterized protein n=1 Tax=Cronartium quercuum f. sp. fusiforme G11 TaxID=708437 RepID=A0A9P6NRC4_9BASI|nr:hypothetical protein CROQUDRAFT_87628 [Cronartium quercuum f. sp. fusiforme G11]